MFLTHQNQTSPSRATKELETIGSNFLNQSLLEGAGEICASTMAMREPPTASDLQREGETPQARRGGLFANHPIRANAPNLCAPSDFCMWDAPTDCGTPRHIGLWMSPTGPKQKCRTVKRMSDVGGEADIKNKSRHFRFIRAHMASSALWLRRARRGQGAAEDHCKRTRCTFAGRCSRESSCAVGASSAVQTMIGSIEKLIVAQHRARTTSSKRHQSILCIAHCGHVSYCLHASGREDIPLGSRLCGLDRACAAAIFDWLQTQARANLRNKVTNICQRILVWKPMRC